MKSPYLLPAITALIGFSIAWIVKPSASQSTTPARTEDVAIKKRPTRPDNHSRPSEGDALPAPKDFKAGEFPLTALAEQGPKTRSEAKMLRLTEALELSIDQQGEIIRLVESVQGKVNPDLSVLEDLTIRGSEVEAGMGKILTPAQLAKFEELRMRERENRIEQQSQKILTETIQEIDLTADQREDVLDRLRQKTKADLQVIPASAALLFEQSLLPTNNKELSLDGVLQAAKMSEHVMVSDPTQAFQQVVNQRNFEMEALLRCFDGILTPGQMGQYQASMAEKNKQLEQVRESIMSKPKK